MERKDETIVALYQLLGQIFYAAAQADKTVRPEEIAELKQIVKDDWLDLENTVDEFNSDSAYQIEIVFDYLVDKDIIQENVIRELEEFKNIHSSLFTPTLVNLIMQTAHRIVSSFAKRNKSELVFLSQLRAELEK